MNLFRVYLRSIDAQDAKRKKTDITMSNRDLLSYTAAEAKHEQNDGVGRKKIGLAPKTDDREGKKTEKISYVVVGRERTSERERKKKKQRHQQQQQKATAGLYLGKIIGQNAVRFPRIP
ncbi:hypothetical protein GWI33_019702 [Rhynchophorus ferrugineus]|uniref:Uncharacterized protein n=1 Tax=Rhynchophorus ferrugineus TaxID=354439 RepID=A0A834M6R3_RHYFE|nr:hypothetical protein GWI33_019702 [Rhynchophorus ferrugineus]